MAISFPRMGTSYIALKDLFQRLGHKVIVPPAPSDATLRLGTHHSPEFACVPYKILLGTYLEVLEKGADFIVTSGGSGPCRAGHYAQLHCRILQELGYQFDMLIMELPRRNFCYFFSCLKKLNRARLSPLAIIDALRHTWAKLTALDELERLTLQVRPFEAEPGITTRTFKQALQAIDRADSMSQLSAALRAGQEALQSLPRREIEPLRIGLVGEIYVLIEPYANLEIEETLGRLGVVVDRSMFLSDWFTNNVVTNTLGRPSEREVRQAAQPYLGEMIGGHGQDSVGHAVLYADRGYDGMIHLSPFTCIPEIVAKSILPRISDERSFPILSLACDELSGRAGLETRLEAFTDMLRMRRQERRIS